jgi:hypothetical protein
MTEREHAPPLHEDSVEFDDAAPSAEENEVLLARHAEFSSSEDDDTINFEDDCSVTTLDDDTATSAQFNSKVDVDLQSFSKMPQSAPSDAINGQLPSSFGVQQQKEIKMQVSKPTVCIDGKPSNVQNASMDAGIDSSNTIFFNGANKTARSSAAAQKLSTMGKLSDTEDVATLLADWADDVDNLLEGFFTKNKIFDLCGLWAMVLLLDASLSSPTRIEWMGFCLMSLSSFYRSLKTSFLALFSLIIFLATSNCMVYFIFTTEILAPLLPTAANMVVYGYAIGSIRGYDPISWVLWGVLIVMDIFAKNPPETQLESLPAIYTISYGAYLLLTEIVSVIVDYKNERMASNVVVHGELRLYPSSLMNSNLSNNNLNQDNSTSSSSAATSASSKPQAPSSPSSNSTSMSSSSSSISSNASKNNNPLSDNASSATYYYSNHYDKHNRFELCLHRLVEDAIVLSWSLPQSLIVTLSSTLPPQQSTPTSPGNQNKKDKSASSPHLLASGPSLATAPGTLAPPPPILGSMVVGTTYRPGPVSTKVTTPALNATAADSLASSSSSSSSTSSDSTSAASSLTSKTSSSVPPPTAVNANLYLPPIPPSTSSTTLTSSDVTVSANGVMLTKGVVASMGDGLVHIKGLESSSSYEIVVYIRGYGSIPIKVCTMEGNGTCLN